jgi:hypothetical protein
MLFILGINIFLIIFIYNLLLTDGTYDCDTHKSHNRWEKNIGYSILHNKYNMPKQLLLTNPIHKLPSGFQYPVVLKPTNKGGGQDVITDIIDDDDLFTTSSSLIKKYKKIVIENQIMNKRECRVLIHKKLGHFSVTERVPITLVGDGIHTVEFLVNKFENDNKHNKHLHYETVIIDDRIIDRKLIPVNGQKVRINNRKNFCLGNIAKPIPKNTIHPDNIRLFYNIMKDIDSSFNGIDILFDDLSVSYKKLPFYLLETNFCPSYNGKKNLINIESVRENIYTKIFASLLFINIGLYYTISEMYDTRLIT